MTWWWRTASLCALVVVAQVGCGDSPSPRVCSPGRSEACACTSGLRGAQTCNAGGTAYGECVCGSGLDGGPTPSDGAPPGADASGNDASSFADGAAPVDATTPPDAAEDSSSGPDAGPCISLVTPPPPDDPDCFVAWRGFSAVNTLGDGCPPLYEQRCVIAEACCQRDDSCALHRFSPYGAACVPRGFSFCDSPDHPFSCPDGHVCTPSGCCPEGRTCHECPTPEPIVPPDLGTSVFVPNPGTEGPLVGSVSNGSEYAGAMVGDELYAYYGAQRDVRYDWDANRWSDRPPPTMGTGPFAAIAVGTDVFLLAAHAGTGELSAFLHNPVTGTYTPRSAAGATTPSAYGGGGVFWDGRYVVLLSLAVGDGLEIAPESRRYEVATDTWLPMSGETGLPMVYFSGGFVAAGSTIYALFSASSPSMTDEFVWFLAEYDASTDRWTRRADLHVPHSRAVSGFTIVPAMIDGALHVFEARESFALFRYDRAADLWSVISTVPRGLERPSATAPGAYDGRVALLGSYFYEPATGRWARVDRALFADFPYVGHGDFIRCSRSDGPVSCTRVTPPDSLPNYCR